MSFSSDRCGLALAFVGSVFPNNPEYQTQAFSPSGRMFQEDLLSGLANAGLRASLVISFLPIPSFPRSRRIWIRGENVVLQQNRNVRLVSFINITPVKQFLIGIATVWNLLRWGWRTRNTKRVVYQYNLTVPPALFTLAASKAIGASTIIELNDINVPGQTLPDSFLNRLDFWLHRKLIPHFDGHITVSDSIMQDFMPNSDYIRVEGGVATKLLEGAADNSQLKASGNQFTVAFAGSLDPVNGIDILLDAFSQLGRGYRLVIAGWGPQEDVVRAAAAEDERIHFVGRLPFPEVLRIYEAADVLVSIRPTKTLHTRYFFPSKLMEYLASGTPVITTCTGHTEEEFGDFCYLLKDESAKALADLIRSVAMTSPEARREKGQRARSYMKEHKTWDRQGHKIVRYIERLCVPQQAQQVAASTVRTKYS